MPSKRKKDDPFDTPEYRQLVANIKKIINEAAAKGVDITQRDDLLSCRYCGAYENVTFEGEWIICDQSSKRLERGKFILVDSRQRSYHRGGVSYYKTTYNFICSVCGAQQEQIVRDRFED